MTANRLARQSKRYKSSDIEVPEGWCSLRIRKQDSRTVRLKEKSEDEAQHGPKRGPGVGFNLLWLEFQNTRWLMHIAFGFVPSFLCSRTFSSSTFLPLLVSRLISHSVFLYHQTILPHGLYPRRECKLILSYIKRAYAANSRPFRTIATFSRSFKRYLCHINRISPLYAPAHECHPGPNTVCDGGLISSRWHRSDRRRKSVIPNEILPIDVHLFTVTP